MSVETQIERRGVDILQHAKRYWISVIMERDREKAEHLKTLTLAELIEMGVKF